MHPMGVFTDKLKPSFPLFFFGKKILYGVPPANRKVELDMLCSHGRYVERAMDVDTYSSLDPHKIRDENPRKKGFFKDVIAVNTGRSLLQIFYLSA